MDWRQGGAVIVAPSVKPEDAPALFPKGVKQHEVPSGKVRTMGKLCTHHIHLCYYSGLHEDHTHAGIISEGMDSREENNNLYTLLPNKVI